MSLRNGIIMLFELTLIIRRDAWDFMWEEVGVVRRGFVDVEAWGGLDAVGAGAVL